MTLNITNKKTKTKDGKNIAFAELTLHIEGQQYPIRLAITGAKEDYIKLDKKKLNDALKAKGFIIGEVGETQEVAPTIISLKGE